MNGYKKHIEALANSNSERIFFNSSQEHAVVVLSQIFTSAKDKVNIYAENLNGGISDKENYLNSLKSFLNKGGKLKILLKDSNSFKENKELLDLLEYYSLLDDSSIQIKETNVSLMLDNKEINFTTADDIMFRLEEDTKEYTAFGYFNNEVDTKDLNVHFNKIFSDKKSKVVKLIN